MEELISLNVGGKAFVTSRSLLTSVKGSLLAMMFDPSSPIPPSQQTNGAFFIEEDPETFRVILCWLRHRTLNASPGVSLNYLISVANYFGIADLEIEAKKKLRLDEDQRREKKGKMMTISNEIAEMSSSLRRLTDGINAVNEKLVTGVKCQSIPVQIVKKHEGY